MPDWMRDPAIATIIAILSLLVACGALLYSFINGSSTKRQTEQSIKNSIYPSIGVEIERYYEPTFIRKEAYFKCGFRNLSTTITMINVCVQVSITDKRLGKKINETAWKLFYSRDINNITPQNKAEMSMAWTIGSLVQTELTSGGMSEINPGVETFVETYFSQADYSMYPLYLILKLQFTPSVAEAQKCTMLYVYSLDNPQVNKPKMIEIEKRALYE